MLGVLVVLSLGVCRKMFHRLTKALGRIRGALLDCFTDNADRRAELKRIEHELDIERDNTYFSQAYGGVHIEKPFEIIEKKRQIAREKYKEKGMTQIVVPLAGKVVFALTMVVLTAVLTNLISPYF